MIRFPWLQRLLKPKVSYAQSNPSNRDRFTEVYRTQRWLVGESVSGPGSDRDSGSVLHSIEVLDRICSEHGVRSMTDVPCGDFHWMPTFLQRRADIEYVGYDIVPELIERNRAAHPEHRFELLDIVTQTPPAADLLFSKDLVNHLFERDVWAALANMAASGSRLILITSNAGYPNAELKLRAAGASRELNLMTAPYSLPEPLYADHYLSLWSGEQIAERLARRSAQAPT